jgi:hypothetical protein
MQSFKIQKVSGASRDQHKVVGAGYGGYLAVRKGRGHPIA